MNSAATARPLAGRRVLITREQPGRLGALLAERGATPVHVPLIATVDPPDGGAALRETLEGLGSFDWLVVTSPAGARRVAEAARQHKAVRLAAVGTSTAGLLAEIGGRDVELTPRRQLASELAAELIEVAGLPPVRILVAQGNRASGHLVDVLLDAGHDVIACTAYSTIPVAPDVGCTEGADALVLASGSAAESWANATVGRNPVQSPPITVAIGPSTAERAQKFGLKVCGVATDHSLEGLVDELERQFQAQSKI